MQWTGNKYSYQLLTDCLIKCTSTFPVTLKTFQELSCQNRTLPEERSAVIRSSSWNLPGTLHKHHIKLASDDFNWLDHRHSSCDLWNWLSPHCHPSGQGQSKWKCYNCSSGLPTQDACHWEARPEVGQQQYRPKGELNARDHAENVARMPATNSNFPLSFDLRPLESTIYVANLIKHSFQSKISQYYFGENNVVSMQGNVLRGLLLITKCIPHPAIHNFVHPINKPN